VLRPRDQHRHGRPIPHAGKPHHPAPSRTYSPLSQRSRPLVLEGCIATVTADGAYDSDAVYHAAARQHGPPPDVVIPPRACAVPSTNDPAAQTPRDRHIQLIVEKGRMAWQRATGYGRRSLVETAIGRYKHLIGPKLRARTLPGQQGEAALAVAVLNRMIKTAKPVTVRRT